MKQRTGRAVRTLALVTVLALTASACSGAPAPEAAPGSTAAPDAKQANAALTAGLKAHSAGNLDTATAKYKTALRYDGTKKFAFYNLAIIDEANANYGLAEDKYRSALRIDAAYQPALFNLAILRSDTDAKEAISLYEDVVAADKKDAAAWLNLGLLRRTTGQERAGDRDVLRAIALNPDLKDPEKMAPGNGVAAP